MLVTQADQAHERTHGFNASLLDQSLCPLRAATSQLRGPPQPIFEIRLQAALAAADAQHSGELSGFPARVEKAHLPLVPAHPDLLADIFGRRRVKGLGYLHITVPMHRARSFLEY